MNDEHPYLENGSPRRPRRRWMVPALLGGIAALAAAAAAVTLVLRPASEPEEVKPSTEATSAAPSASPKPPAQPSPRVRIDCEKVLDRADVATYLGGAPTLQRDAPVDLLSVAWLQQGGLGCVWLAGNHRLRVTALPLDVMPASYLPLLRESGADSGPLPLVDAPLVSCGAGGCDARAATETVAIHVTESLRAAGDEADDPAVFTPLAVTAMQRIAAAGAPSPLWVAPYAQTVPTIADCESLDPHGVIGAALGGTVAYGRGYYDDPPLLEGAAMIGGPVRDCVPTNEASGPDGAPSVRVLPFSRWAWDRLKSAQVADGAVGVDLAGADAAIERWAPDSDSDPEQSGNRRIFALRGDAILIAEFYSVERSDSRSAAALSAWLIRYAA